VTPSENTIQGKDGRKHRIFFVRGHMRSGTNWTGALLNLHPRISCCGEFHFERLGAAFDHFCERRWLAEKGMPVAEAARDMFAETIRRCIGAVIPAKPHAMWVGDRTPAPIDRLLPGAPTIHIVRDGRDVLVSWMFHRLGMDQPLATAELQAWRETFLDRPSLFVEEPQRLLCHEPLVRERARIWREHVVADLATIAAAQHDPRGPVLSLTYESLHEDVEARRAEMYEFLGLDPAEAEPLGDDNWTRPGFDRVNPSSFYRQGEVGAWRRYFTPDAERWFKEEAGDALVRLGYETDASWSVTSCARAS